MIDNLLIAYNGAYSYDTAMRIPLGRIEKAIKTYNKQQEQINKQYKV
jgi:hypothetical protein